VGHHAQRGDMPQRETERRVDPPEPPLVWKCHDVCATPEQFFEWRVDDGQECRQRDDRRVGHAKGAWEGITVAERQGKQQC
jgi:hypothetical protein